MTLLAFAVLGLGVYRITRLITTDSITDRPRAWVSEHSDWFWDDLLNCPWCAGWWVSLAASVAYFLWPDPTFWVLLPFALSAVTGLLAEIG